ncbi:hypothetical protein OCU04_012895 [Sclerotinia nivalis]|uniref:Uncharacterized protein n=1 Tax=Sclerotinia nivalis TaxID=352851 RepID=A0A9X0A9H2_9HELO|nr:hypothetical protein OCU04_012895 [Sclerotinia nivalis]
MHPKNLLIFFFLAVSHSTVSEFQGGKFDAKIHDARAVSVSTGADAQPYLVTNDQPDRRSAIVTTFKTIVTARNAKIAVQDPEMTISPEVADNLSQIETTKHQTTATTTTTAIRTTSNLVQSKKRRNTLDLGPLAAITPSAISTEFTTLVIPDFTTFSLSISTISAN